MKRQKGITLIALVITIIVLLILAGVTLNSISGENNIWKTASVATEQYNKSQVKEKIELVIVEKKLDKKTSITVDEIVNKLIEKGITKEESSDEETGVLITEEGYTVMIKDNGNGSFEVVIGEKGEIPLILNLKATPAMLTNKTTIEIKGVLLEEGIKELTMPDGSKKEYAEGTSKIEETYEVTENGTYKFIIEGNDGQKKEKEITIKNIVEGVITISPSTTAWTKESIQVEVIYPEGTEGLIREISTDGGTTWKEYTGAVEITENTTVKARLKNEIEEIKSASMEISNIEKTAPIVTATQESIEVTVGLSNETSQYFTISENGEAPITSIEYSITNTGSLAVGTHTITCTATKANGLSASESITLTVKKLEYTKLTYTTAGTYTWTVPEGVTTIQVTVAGAGGGGRR